MAESMRATVASMLRGIDRYNPDNLPTLEKYVEIQARENAYDLEANLAVLKLYQFNPGYYVKSVVEQILLKALTNLPHTDFVLCKCLLDQVRFEELHIKQIMELHHLLETCNFRDFWAAISPNKDFSLTNENLPEDEQEKELLRLQKEKEFHLIFLDKLKSINGYEDSIRKFICHIINITFQRVGKTFLAELLGNLSENQLSVWMNKYGWKDIGNGLVFVANQEENIKTKNIAEKIDFESTAAIMSSCR